MTELTSDVQADAIGAAVTVYLPAALAADLRRQAQGWDFCCDMPADGVTYLMLNCDEAELTRVLHALGANGLHPVRSGFSYNPASDGRQYRWYVRLESIVTNARLGQLLSDTLGASRRDVPASRYIEEFDAENHRLRGEIGALRNENADLKAQLESALNAVPRPPRSPRRRAEVKAVIDAVFPGMVLLRDSLSVMERELASCEPVFHALRILRWEPPAFPPKAKPVQSASEWWESHFRTGQRDDGRLYFRKGGDGRWSILVSFKGFQDRDLDYLKGH